MAERFADFCVPRTLLDRNDVERRRARALVWLCWVWAVTGLALSVSFESYGYRSLATTQAIAAASVAMFPFLLRVTRSVDLVTRALLVLLVVTFSMQAIRQGGITAPAAIGLVAAPAVAAMLLSLSEALFWAGVAVASLLGLYFWGTPHETAASLAILPPALSLTRCLALTLLGTFIAVVLQTSSRSAFEALARSEAKARALLEAIPDSMIRLDRQGKLLDGTPIESWPDAASHVVPRLQEVLDTRHPQTFEHSAKDRTFEVRLAAIDDQTAMMMIRDITDRRAMETALVRAERERVEAVTAERLARTEKLAALGRVAAGIAHEINNPLTFVLANLGYVREQLGQPDHQIPELDEVLSEALEGAVRVQRIVAGLRVFGRMEDNRPEAIDPNSALDAAILMTSNEIRHRARLTLRQSPVPPARLPKGRLEQVLINLLANAAQAIAVGRVEENEIVVVTSVHPNGGTLIEVTDSGAGIPADKLARVAEPFFTTKPIGQGVGLGLTISYGIIQEAGGEIWLKSDTGRGTSAFVHLPAGEMTADLAPIGPAASPIARLRILVIDDEDLIVRALRRLLPEHEIVTVASGRDASAMLLTDQAFDVVLCDLMMPDQTGMEVYERVAVKQPSLAERFIFMSGGLLSQAAGEFVARFTDRILTKPFDRSELTAAIARGASPRSSSPPAPGHSDRR